MRNAILKLPKRRMMNLERLDEALERLADAATTTVTARFTDEREIPVLVSAISDARDALSAYRDAMNPHE